MPALLRRPALAVGALALAVLVWGGVALRQGQRSPAQARVDAGLHYAAEGNGRAAERAWEEATRLDPANADPWELLAGLYQSTDRALALVMALQQVQRLRPASPHIRARLAEALMRTGDEARALALARAELADEPRCAPALKVAAQALKNGGGDGKLLVEYARTLTEVEPANVAYLLFYADSLTVRSRYKEAEPLLERILAMSPDNASAYGMRGAIRFGSDLTPDGQKRAEADFRRALQCNPMLPMPRLFLGKLYRRQGRAGDAVFQLEEAVRLMPRSTDARYELAGAYRQAGREPEAKVALAAFESLRKSIDEGTRLRIKAIAEPGNGPLHRQIGMRLFRQGDLRQAASFLKVALTLKPDDPEVRAAMKQILARDGVGDPDAVLETILKQVHGKS